MGFVPLLDAAPLVLAGELGYFADEGLNVVLERQIGWGNVRDKLAYGHLHASHALVGMPPSSVLGRERWAEPVAAIATLSRGGNGITLGRRLTNAGVNSAAALGEWIRRRLGDGPPVMAHVFGSSPHHYLLREWLARAGLDPDRDVRLCVLPPPQMDRQLASGYLDGFCVGEPWNTAAELDGTGRVVAATTDVVPNHANKVLAANRRWLASHADEAAALLRAVVRACGFYHDRANAGRVAEVMAKPSYLDVSADVLATSLARRAVAPVCDPAAVAPEAGDAAWIVRQMVRWGHLPASVDVDDVARRAVDASVVVQAFQPARSLVVQAGMPAPQS